MGLSRVATVIFLVAGCTRVPLSPAVGHADLSCVAAPSSKSSKLAITVPSRHVSLITAVPEHHAPPEPNTTGTSLPGDYEPPEVERARHIAELEARFRRWDEAAKRAISSVCNACFR